MSQKSGFPDLLCSGFMALTEKANMLVSNGFPRLAFACSAHCAGLGEQRSRLVPNDIY